MDDIYYLVHSTDKDPSDFKFLKKTTCKESIKDQFPGVFMTLVTKYNINKEHFFPGKYIMIFSKELLKQNNYHINVMDCNGMITEHITYFPWNINEAVKYIKSKDYGGTNEVVFHDEIDIKKYLCKIITKPTAMINGELSKNYENFLNKGGLHGVLPKKEMKTSAKPDMTKTPFYCFTIEDIYSGIPVPPKSSLEWFQLLIKVANIDKIPNSIQGCIDTIRKKFIYLCNHREEQNIQLLKDYTLKKATRKINNKTRKNNNPIKKINTRRKY